MPTVLVVYHKIRGRVAILSFSPIDSSKYLSKEWDRKRAKTEGWNKCQRNNKETWTKGFRSIAGGCCDGMETVVVVYVQVDKDLSIDNVFAEVMHVGVSKFGEGYSEVISNSLFSFDLENAEDEINKVLGVAK